MFYELPVIAFLAATLVLVPLPWHWRARNISTLAIIFWLFLTNITYCVNAIVWGNDVIIRLEVWCDIVTKLQMGASIALPAACFCLCLRLASVASVRQAGVTESQKRRRIILDFALCFGLPCIYMALHFVVQGHRFDIVQGYGCRPVVYESVAAIFITFLPPLVLDIGTCGCAVFAFIQFYQRRATFAKHLQDSSSALTPSRYFRLMAMCAVEVVWGIFVSSANIWFTCRYGLRPWISWSNVHYEFSQIGQFPTVLISASDRAWAYVLWLMVPISTFIFFAFFAFGQDAMKEYRQCFRWIRRVLLRRRDVDTSSSPSFGSSAFPSPTYIKPLKALKLVDSGSYSTSSVSTQTLTSYDGFKKDVTYTKDHGEKSFASTPFSPTLSLPSHGSRTLADAEGVIAGLPSASPRSSPNDRPTSSYSRPCSLRPSDIREIYIQTHHMV